MGHGGARRGCGRKSQFTDRQRREALEMFNNGASYADIAQRFGICRGNVAQLLKQARKLEAAEVK